MFPRTDTSEKTWGILTRICHERGTGSTNSHCTVRTARQRSSVREPGGRCRPSRIHTHPPPNTGNTRTRLLGARTLLARENRERYQRHSCAECTIRGDDGRCWRSTERGVPHVEAQRAGTTQPDRGCRIHRQEPRRTAHMVYLDSSHVMLPMYHDKPPHIRGMGTVSGVTPCATMNASTWSQKNWLTAGGAPQPSKGRK